MPYNFVPDSFHTGVTAEALRETTRRAKRGHFAPKFQVEGVAPTNHFCTVRPMNALQLRGLSVFTQRNFVADFLHAKCNFYGNRPFCVFNTPFGGLSSNVRRST